MTSQILHTLWCYTSADGAAGKFDIGELILSRCSQRGNKPFTLKQSCTQRIWCRNGSFGCQPPSSVPQSSNVDPKSRFGTRPASKQGRHVCVPARSAAGQFPFSSTLGSIRHVAKAKRKRPVVTSHAARFFYLAGWHKVSAQLLGWQTSITSDRTTRHVRRCLPCLLLLFLLWVFCSFDWRCGVEVLFSVRDCGEKSLNYFQDSIVFDQTWVAVMFESFDSYSYATGSVFLPFSPQ